MKKRLISIFAICAMLMTPAAALADYGSEEAPAAETVEDAARIERQAEYDKLYEQAKREADIRNSIASEENGDIQLMVEDAVTLSGTVTMPQGATAQQNDSVYIELTQIDKNENGKILYEESYVSRTRVRFDEGASTGSYSITAPKGKYIVSMSTSSVANPLICSSTFYYISPGNYAYDARLGEVQTLDSNKTIDFEIPASKYTVSGKLILPEPAADDMTVNISAYCYGDSSKNARGRATIKKGEASADYMVGLSADGIYYMQINTSGNRGYYSTYGDVSGDYDDRLYLDTSRGSMENMDIMLKTPTTVNTDEDTEDYVNIPVTVTLSEAAEEYCGYSISTYTLNYGWMDGYTDIDIEPGQTTVTADMQVYYDKEDPADFVIRINDYYNDITMYYTADGGVTTNYDKAQVFHTSSIDQIKSINIQIPKMCEVTGTVNRNGFMEGEYAYLRVVGSTDGETYGTSVVIPADSDTAQYTFLIPEKYMNSDFSVHAEAEEIGYDVQVAGDPVTLQFTGGTANQSVNMKTSNQICKLERTVKLPEAAPEGGVLLKITGDYYEANSYVIPAGVTEANIETYIVAEDPTNVKLEINAITADGKLFAEYEEAVDLTEDNTDNVIEMLSSETVKVSGTVSLPQDVTLKSGLTYRVRVSASSDSDYSSNSIYNSIFKNESEASYSVNIPKGYTIDSIYMEVVSAGGSVIYKTTQYYTPEGTDNQYDLNMPAENDIEGVDFELVRSTLISGTIKLPDGAPIPTNARIYIAAEPVNGYNRFEPCVINGVTQDEMPYSLAFSPDFSGDVIIYYYVSDNSHTYNSGTYYYSSSGPVTSEEDAEVITVNGTDITEKDLLLVKNKAAVNLSAQTAYDIPVNAAYGLDISVYLDNGTDNDTMTSLIIDQGETKSDEVVIGIPDIAETADMTPFKLCYRVSMYNEDENLEYDYNYEYIYINPDGTCTQYADKAQEFGMENKDVAFTVYPSSHYAAEAAANGDLEITEANVTRTEDGFNVTANYTDNAPLSNCNVKAIVCAYDNNNRLLGTACGDVTLYSSGEDDVVSTDIKSDLTGDKYRLYLWNNMWDITPLHTPFEITELN